MKKRLLSGLLALTLVFSGSISAVAAEPAVTTEITAEDTTADVEATEETAEETEEVTGEETTEDTEEVTEEETTEDTEEVAEEETTEDTEEVAEEETTEDTEEVSEEVAEDAEEAAEETAEAVVEEVAAEATATEVVSVEETAAYAAEEWVEEGTEYVLNPIYEEYYTTDDLVAYIAQMNEQSDTEKKFNAAVYEYDSIADAANAIKNEMKARSTSCTIITNKSNTYKAIFKEALVDSIATAPNEGDYLRANWYGYSLTSYTSSTQAKYVVTLMYVDDAEKEAAVTNAIPGVLNSLNLTGKTDFEKVKIIHDYVCEKIVYTTDGSSLVYHSTYGALINGQAVCQGYASLFYRLCREAGISARFITGVGGGGAHAWNIVRLGNYYYNLDATWADQDENGIYYDYFLRSESDFSNHTREADSRDGMDYTSSAFYAAYPMAPTYYGAMAEMNIANVAKTFTKTDATTVTSTASGKPKMLAFINVSNSDCADTFQAISKSSYVTGGKVDVVAVDLSGNTASTVDSFKSSYGTSAMNFCYSASNDALYAATAYDDLCGLGVYSGDPPVIYYIDANNKIKAATYGAQTTSEVDAILAKVISGNTNTTYSITAGCGIGGTISPDGISNVAAGGSVTYTITPASGYGISDVVVDGASVGAKATYSFTNVTANHTIVASFTKISADNPFADVKPGAYYETPVKWAVSKGITSGTSPTTFEPNADCTRAQIVTFLWRAAGSPEPSSTSNPFVDVQSSAYYYKAVLWAVERGITSGTSGNTFSPNDICTRGQSVTFLYRYAGQPSVGSTANPFGDVKSGAYYYNPVLWAMSNGVTSGTSATTFEPNANCTRGQIVTFLYRQAN